MYNNKRTAVTTTSVTYEVRYSYKLHGKETVHEKYKRAVLQQLIFNESLTFNESETFFFPENLRCHVSAWN